MTAPDRQPRVRAPRKTFSWRRHRNLRLCFIGQSISNSGNWLTHVALTLLVIGGVGCLRAAGVSALAANHRGVVQ